MDEKLRERLLYVKGLKDIKANVSGFKGELLPYQKVAVAFGVLARRCIIGDPCGAGKTIEAIGIDLKLREIGEVRRTLVVCLSDKRWEWVSEYQKFSSLPVAMIDGKNTVRTEQWLFSQVETGVTVCSYEQVRSDMVRKFKDDLNNKTVDITGLCMRMNFDLIIFDEASVFKSPESLLADSLRAIVTCAKPSAVLALTATPIQKKLTDLFSIMEKVDSSALPSYNEFVDSYIIRKRFETWTPRGRKVFFWKDVAYQNLDKLSHVMAPYWIARSREETLGTRVTQVRKIRYVSMRTKQRAAYEDLRASVDEGTARGRMLEVYGRMEMAVDTACHFDKECHESAKLDDIMDLLQGELAAEKVLIFSKRHLILEELEVRLKSAKIGYIRYTGREDPIIREKNKDLFNSDPAVQVALVTTAAEMGKNFHASHYVVFLNHVMNPARIDQIIGRVDRGVAQKSDFICSIHYACKDSFEEDVIPKIDKERELARQVLNRNAGNELIELLSDTQLYNLIKNGKVSLEEVGWTNTTQISTQEKQ